MKMIAIIATVVAVSVIAPLHSCAVQTNDVGTSHIDERVGSALKQIGLHYLIDEEENYILTFSGGDTDTNNQRVHINSSTSKIGMTEVREIWSIAYITDKPISADIAYKLLRRNAVIKDGAWSIDKGEGGVNVIVFTAVIDADEKATTVSNIANLVAITTSGVAEELKNGTLWSPDDAVK